MRLLLLIASFSLSFQSIAQGDLAKLHDQSYMNTYYAKPFNCDKGEKPSGMTRDEADRICANARLQVSDTLLALYDDSLMIEIAKTHKSDLFMQNMEAQEQWRTKRDKECLALELNSYASVTATTRYLNEMRKLTDIHIVELKAELKRYQADDH